MRGAVKITARGYARFGNRSRSLRTQSTRMPVASASSEARKKAPPLSAAGQLSSHRTIIAIALSQAVSFGISASRRRVSPELRAAFVV